MTALLPVDTLQDLLKVGERGASRHKRRVIDALRKGASELLLNQDVVTASGGKRVRVRVRLLETPTFRYDYHDEVQVGIGKGQKPGDILIDENPAEEGEGSGAGEGDGTSYDVEMSVDEVIELLLEEWALPNLEAKKRNEIVSEDYKLTDISRKGPMSRIDKKRTIKNAIKRAVATEGELVIYNDDMRFRSPKAVPTYSSNAVIVLVRDRSGSMGTFEMKVSRITAIWLVQFLRRRYDAVTIRFLLHDHVAQEVDESTFYHVTSGGGTSIANAYKMASKVLDEYSLTEYNRYIVHFSDGDDWDTRASINEMQEIVDKVQAFVYYEIGHGGGSSLDFLKKTQSSDFWQAQHDIEEANPHFIRYAIDSEDDVALALKAFLSADVA